MESQRLTGSSLAGWCPQNKRRVEMDEKENVVREELIR